VEAGGGGRVRHYAQLRPQFWTGETGRALRTEAKEARIVAVYLMSAPGANLIGLYYLPTVTICHETGLTADEVAAALAVLDRLNFAHYDPRLEVVWVVEMAAHQVGETLKPQDKRAAAVAGELAAYRRSGLHARFVARYGESFSILRSPFEAPSKPLPDSQKPLPGISEAPSKGLVTDTDPAVVPAPDPAAAPGGTTTRAKPVPVPLPDWLPRPLWEEWREHRRLMREPMTHLGERRLLAKLGGLRDAGHDPGAVIGLAIERGYRGFFEPKNAPAQGPAPELSPLPPGKSRAMAELEALEAQAEARRATRTQGGTP